MDGTAITILATAAAAVALVVAIQFRPRRRDRAGAREFVNNSANNENQLDTHGGGLTGE